MRKFVQIILAGLLLISCADVSYRGSKSFTGGATLAKREAPLKSHLEVELSVLEEELSGIDLMQYEMIKDKIGGTSELIFFLKLNKYERKIYLSYVFNGDMPVIYRKGPFGL